MFGAAIKAVGEWTLHVLTPYGSPSRKDAHGEYFTARTDLAEEHHGLPPAVYYHGYSETKRQMPKPEYVGKATKRWKAPEGIWHEVELDPRKPRSAKLMKAAREGKAASSPGTAEHLIRRSADGHLDHWPIVELSVFDTYDGQRPANPYAVAIPAIKAIYDEAGIALPADIDLVELDAKGTDVQRAAAPASGHPGIKSSTHLEDRSMNEDEIKALTEKAVKDALAARDAADAAARQREEEIEAEVAKRVEAKTKNTKSADDLAANRLQFGGGNGGGQAPYVTQFADVAKYDNLTFPDQATMVNVLQAAKEGGRSRGGASAAAVKALFIKAVEDKDSIAAERTRHAIKADGIPLATDGSIKANELNRGDLAGYGDEWVGQAQSNVMWEKIRDEAKVAMRFPAIEIPQGAESITAPLDGAAPTFYNVAGATDLNATTGRPDATVPASKLATDKKVIDSARLGARVLWDGALEEDSVLPWVQELRTSLQTEGALVLDHVSIDGDTALAATTNINHIGGTPNAAAAYTAFNGLRKLALVTNTANSRDGAAADFTDIVSTMQLLGENGLGALDAAKCAAIIDLGLNWKLLALLLSTPNYNIVTVRADGVRVINVAGFEVIVTEAMHRASANRLTNGAGKIDQTTPANNTKSAIVGVRWDQWRMAFKRRMTMEVSRFAESDTNQITCLMRVKLHNRDNEGASVSYNLS